MTYSDRRADVMWAEILSTRALRGNNSRGLQTLELDCEVQILIQPLTGLLTPV